MRKSNREFGEDARLRVAVTAYYAVIMVAFAIGLYGFFSLVWLASAEVQHSVQIMGSLR